MQVGWSALRGKVREHFEGHFRSQWSNLSSNKRCLQGRVHSHRRLISAEHYYSLQAFAKLCWSCRSAKQHFGSKFNVLDVFLAPARLELKIQVFNCSMKKNDFPEQEWLGWHFIGC